MRFQLIKILKTKMMKKKTKMMKRKRKRKTRKVINNEVSVLPQEIISEIIKEVPVKTLLRFRCVSKLWRSIIDDDPLFAQSHYNRSVTRRDGINLLFLTKSHYNWQIYSADPKGGPALHLLTIPISSDDQQYFPLYSVKGLVCFQNCIWNPSTRQRIAIPRIRIRSPTPYIEIGYNRLTVISVNLLGFDPSSGKHKVLNISEIVCDEDLYDKDDDEQEPIQTQFKVLTLSSHGGGASTWRCLPQEHQLDRFSATRFCGDAKRACCINDIIYCLGMIGYSNSVDVILAFEVGPESFKIIPFPQGAQSHQCFAIEVRESLALINFEVTKIWILEDYDKQLWIHQRLNAPHFYPFYPVNTALHDGGAVCGTGCEILFQYRNSEFFYYDLGSDTVRMVPNLLNLPENMSSSSVLVIKHVESLF